ncbi:MAG: hypothetical protein ACTJG2_00365 [Candidatus Saccharimonadales bacterium]
MKKLLFIILGLIIVAGAGAAAYFLYFAPQPTAKRTADSVMRAANVNQPDTIRQHGAESNVERFVNASSQRNFRTGDTTQVDAVYYFSYEFTDEQSPKKARIGIENNSVAALAVGDNLGATPDEDGEETITAADAPDLCLTRDDLRYLDSERPYAKNFRAATMIFVRTGDKLGYSGEENGKNLLDRVGNFYKRSHEKDYQIMLRGYAPDPEAYPEAYEAQVRQSNNRANKIYEDLVGRGIARDRITIDNPRIYNQTPPDNQDDWVDIDVVSQCE